MYKIFIVLILSSYFLNGQQNSKIRQYDGNYYESKIKINNKDLKCFKTNFLFAQDEVYYGFWKYAKTFSRPEKFTSYYQITIPSKINEGNVDLILYGEAVAKGLSCDFYLTIDTENIPEDKQIEYFKQVKDILIEFKKNFYINYYQSIIDESVKELNIYGLKFEKVYKNKEDERIGDIYLEKIDSIQNNISILRKKQVHVSIMN